ncbi:MAG: crosslink repair DNA glycosylase YcaQ family protein, partial [Betaproteobacteria bacterium]
FVQADPIRAPARAQDLTLRHRVAGYRAGDLERLYPGLAFEEDAFVNYGFLPRAHHHLMHPRVARNRWGPATTRRSLDVLAFVRERGEAHPRDVDAALAHGAVRNAWGGSSNATTHLLDGMHYRGLLRVARRDNGIRVYTAREPTAGAAGAAERKARLDALVDVLVRKYAPIPAARFNPLVRRLRYGVPQWRADFDGALRRAQSRLAHGRVDGVDWVWPADEDPRVGDDAAIDRARLLAPFDPVVWDRLRFERFWGWAYRFEAYTPPAARKLGYYALPLLWRDHVVGWANLAVAGTVLQSTFGFVAGRRPGGVAFARELERELADLRRFLAL